MFVKSDISKAIDEIDEFSEVIEEGFVGGLVFVHKIYEIKYQIIKQT